MSSGSRPNALVVCESSMCCCAHLQVDEEFSSIARELTHRADMLFNIYRNLVLKDSAVCGPTSMFQLKFQRHWSDAEVLTIAHKHNESERLSLDSERLVFNSRKAEIGLLLLNVASSNRQRDASRRPGWHSRRLPLSRRQRSGDRLQT